jgi:chromosome segregation protein
MAESSRLLSRAEAERNILAGRLETLTQAVSRHGEEAASAERQLVEAEAGQKALEDLTTMRARVESAKSTVEAARLTMLAKRTAHDEIKREGEARERRIDQIASEVDGWQKRLDTAKSRMAELNTRRIEAEAQLQDAKNKPDHLAGQRAELVQKIKDAEARKTAAADALSVAEGIARTATSAERDAERSASDAREARAASEARRDGAAESVAHAAERIHEEMEVTPDALLEQLETDPTDMASAEKLEGDVMRLRRQRDALGAVNLRAEEDAREVQTEHDTLLSEKQDLEAAISKLRSGIAALNKEGRERLLTAFDEVNRNFGQLFSHLFGGGEARLVLVESDDPLEAGLEILCQPPGKKLSTLSLLSGGEQTLTALALIFAVFLANPAPICVLDEVDAPLDDANVTRFCDMLDEMTRRTKTRFLIITHHAVTMARMDRLFGVTMAEQGVSQLVSVDLKKAEALVA